MAKLACLTCRKVFSSTHRWERANKVCPQCGGRLRDAGSAFKAPKRGDKRAWKIVGMLLTAGILFYPYNLNTPHGRPTKLRDVEAWIKWYKRGPYWFPSKNTRLRRRVEDGEL